MDVSSLENIIRGYGIAIDRRTLQAALDDPEHGTAFTEWARLHLGPDNLLSRDELALYSSLDKSGQIDKLVASRDLAAVQALSEREIQTAIDELNRSTAAIVKQTETLKQQQDALAKLVKSNTKVEEARSDLVFQRNQKHGSERKKMTTSLEELSQNLEYKAADLEQQSKVSGNGLQQTLDSLLHSDDKLLLSLRKLGLELETEDPEDRENVERLREICMRLIKYTVETVRTKLDRLYLEALSSAHHDGVTSHPSDDVKTSQEELESLYAEILPVAQMSVEQQYLEPALKSLSSKNGQSLHRSAAAVVYNQIDECLDYLLDHIERLSARIEAFQSHQAATTSLLATARSELAAPVSTPRKKTPVQDPVSPIRRRNTGPGSPSRNRFNTNYRRRSSGLDEPPLEALLRSLAIAFPEDATDGARQTAVLSATLAERQAKARDVARNTQETLEGAAASQLADAKLAVQLLRDSLLAESPFGDVRLVDEGIEASIAVLGQEVEKVKERIERVDAGKARQRSERKREILERWGQ
ncbi:vacuolar H+/Ca2+ exchanger [Colletotrichum tofieldiae]|nr:vacuolar H+/Ca2+ exchanger [Colletotrichum tofieldiae]GKT81847.1 vacuolar H+/Ca2+ exchanger [Colletotrichum tofieldiae]